MARNAPSNSAHGSRNRSPSRRSSGLQLAEHAGQGADVAEAEVGDLEPVQARRQGLIVAGRARRPPPPAGRSSTAASRRSRLAAMTASRESMFASLARSPSDSAIRSPLARLAA